MAELQKKKIPFNNRSAWVLTIVETWNEKKVKVLNSIMDLLLGLKKSKFSGAAVLKSESDFGVVFTVNGEVNAAYYSKGNKNESEALNSLASDFSSLDMKIYQASDANIALLVSSIIDNKRSELLQEHDANFTKIMKTYEKVKSKNAVIISMPVENREMFLLLSKDQILGTYFVGDNELAYSTSMDAHGLFSFFRKAKGAVKVSRGMENPLNINAIKLSTPTPPKQEEKKESAPAEEKKETVEKKEDVSEDKPKINLGGKKVDKSGPPKGLGKIKKGKPDKKEKPESKPEEKKEKKEEKSAPIVSADSGKKDNKMPIIIGAAAAVVVIIILAVVMMGGGDKDDPANVDTGSADYQKQKKADSLAQAEALKLKKEQEELEAQRKAMEEEKKKMEEELARQRAEIEAAKRAAQDAEAKKALAEKERKLKEEEERKKRENAARLAKIHADIAAKKAKADSLKKVQEEKNRIETIYKGEPYQPLQVDIKPVLVNQASPTYPRMAVQAGVEGNVFVRVLVGRDGKPINVKITRGNDLLHEAAKEAAMNSNYSPASKDGINVRCYLDFPIRFSLGN